MQRYIPVSYTHLDVYKRQTQLDVRNIVCDEESKNVLLEQLYAEMSDRESQPVSYTHLDVYKRQALHSAGAWKDETTHEE